MLPESICCERSKELITAKISAYFPEEFLASFYTSIDAKEIYLLLV